MRILLVLACLLVACPSAAPLDPSSPLITEAPGRYGAALRSDDPRGAVAEMLVWLGELDEVELAWTDVSGLEITARMSDGRLLRFAYQRRDGFMPEGYSSGLEAPPFGQTAREVPITTLVPAQDALLASGFPEEPWHVDIVNDLQGPMEDVGFEVVLTDEDSPLTVAQLADLASFNLILLHSHGGLGPIPDPSGPPTWTVTTHDTWDPNGTISDVEAAWEQWVDDGHLIQTWIDWGDDAMGDPIERPVWAVSEEFIQAQNPQLPEGTLVMLQTCFGYGGCDTFMEMGAAACTGWDESVRSSFNGQATSFLVESLLMERHAPEDQLEPPLRALSVGESLAVMDWMSLLVDVEDAGLDPELLGGVSVADTDVAVLPAVTDVSFDLLNQAMRISGRFGVEEGTVVWDGSEVEHSVWTPWQVLVPITQTVAGPGALQVWGGNEAVRPSNALYAAEYSGTAELFVTHPWYDGPVSVSGTALQLTGGVRDHTTFDGWLPLHRTLQWRPDATMSWNLNGFAYGEDSTIATAFTGSGPVEPGSLVWVLDDEDLGLWSALTLSVPHTVTEYDDQGNQTGQFVINTPAPLQGGSESSPIATTGAHDPETGNLWGGQASWSSVLPAGQVTVSATFGGMAPVPAIPEDAPR